jgi:prepilin-type processing-associated H-X9-DG protein
VVAKGLDYGRGGFTPTTINEGYLLFSFLNGSPSYLRPAASISLKPPSSAAAVDLNKDTDGNWKNIRFRHGNNFYANALMVDGHVQTFLMKDISNSNLLRGNVYVNR